MVSLDQDFRTGPLASATDDVLIFVMSAIDVENEEVWLERIEIGFRRFDEQLRNVTPKARFSMTRFA